MGNATRISAVLLVLSAQPFACTSSDDGPSGSDTPDGRATAGHGTGGGGGGSSGRGGVGTGGNVGGAGGSRRDAGGGARDGGGGSSSDASDAAVPDAATGDAARDGASVDGAAPDGALPGTAEVRCRSLPDTPGAVCVTSKGSSTSLLLSGTVLTPTTIYRGGQVAIDEGIITCVGCDCAAAVPSATGVTCSSGVISPGLVNAHDHLNFAQNSPYVDTGERYEQRHDWRVPERQHTKIAATGGATADQVRWGELRLLLSGATSTVGQGTATGLLRNLDKSDSDQAGLAQTPVHSDTFPLDDAVGTQLTSGCAYGPNRILASALAPDDAYLPHVAEGIDAVAANEFVCLSASDPTHDVVTPKSAFVHGVALSPSQFADMAANHTALVWSPRSNVALYGDTARVTVASRAGVLLALGSDWIISGSMNLGRELRCADSLNRDRLASFFGDEALWRMVTLNAAVATATDDVVGVLAPHRVADVAIFDARSHRDFRAVIDAEPADVTLVLRDGKPLYGDAPLVAGLTTDACDALDVCGSPKSVCLASEIGKTLGELELATPGLYEAFFCGTPRDEPTCTPSRGVSVGGSSLYDGTTSAADRDGDGIEDASDDCRRVFDPIRPDALGLQADADGDGIGDACDPCPLEAGSTSCAAVDPYDRDGDGVAAPLDVCPTIADPAQADADGDGKGDACDACPNAANPGDVACPGTIYDVRNGTIAASSRVSLRNALVTERAASGYFVQVAPTDSAFAGADYSGLFVFEPGNTVTVGSRVDVSRAVVASYFGEIQLTAPRTWIVAVGPASPPVPVVVNPTDVATGGSRALALEGVLVEVDSVTVIDDAPPPGPGDAAPTHEFAVTGALRVNDFAYAVSPLPTIGTTFSRIVGVLRLANGNTKIEPRSANDLVTP